MHSVCSASLQCAYDTNGTLVITLDQIISMVVRLTLGVGPALGSGLGLGRGRGVAPRVAHGRGAGGAGVEHGCSAASAVGCARFVSCARAGVANHVQCLCGASVHAFFSFHER